MVKEEKNVEIKSKVIDTMSSITAYGIAAIPYIGGPLSAIYFDIKGRVRFRRIENFYKDLAKEVEVIQDQIPDIDNFGKEEMAAIIEEVNEKVEREHCEKKIQYIKNYFKNSLVNPVTKDNFDERRFFLDVLSEMTLLECDILLFLNEHRDEDVDINGLKSEDADKYAVRGAIGRLVNYGFIISIRKGLTFGGDTILGTGAKINDFGKKFLEFCLK